MRSWEEVDKLQILPARLVDRGIVGHRFFCPPQSWTVFDELILSSYYELKNPQIKIVTPEDLKHPHEATHDWVAHFEEKTRSYDIDKNQLDMLAALGVDLCVTTHIYRFEVKPEQFHPLDDVYVSVRHEGFSPGQTHGMIGERKVKVGNPTEPLLKLELVPVDADTLVAFAENRLRHQVDWKLPDNW